MRHTHTRWLALTLVLLLGLAACGGDDTSSTDAADDAADAGTATTDDADDAVGEDGEDGEPADDGGGEAAYDQGADDETIKIGLFAPLSGSAAVFGKGQHTIESMYRELNEAGGINGRQIELVVEDSQCDPSTLRLAVTRLIEREQVFMLHGGMCSNAVLNVLPLIEDTGIPTLITGAATTELTDPPKPNIFHGWVDQSGGTRMNAELVVSYAQETGAETIALVATGDEWGVGWSEGFESDLAEVMEREGVSLEVISRSEIPDETGDATAQVRAVADSGADLSVVYAYPQPMSVYLRDAHAQGLDIPVFTGQATFAEDQLDRVGNRDAIQNFFGAFCLGAPLESPELDVYRDALAEHYPEDDFDASAMLGVAGFDINVEILTRMGDDITWDNWIATAETIDGFETPAAPSTVGYAPLDENDPGTRVAAATCNVAHVHPDEDAESPVVVFSPDWSEWEALAGE